MPDARRFCRLWKLSDEPQLFYAFIVGKKKLSKAFTKPCGSCDWYSSITVERSIRKIILRRDIFIFTKLLRFPFHPDFVKVEKNLQKDVIHEVNGNLPLLLYKVQIYNLFINNYSVLTIHVPSPIRGISFLSESTTLGFKSSSFCLIYYIVNVSYVLLAKTYKLHRLGSI